jgi:hypothetical protein
MYLTTEHTYVIHDHTSLIDCFPDIKEKIIENWLLDFNKVCEHRSPEEERTHFTVKDIVENDMIYKSFLEYLDQEGDLYDTLDNCSDSCRGEADLIDYTDNTPNGIHIIIYKVNFYNKNDYLKFLGKTWGKFNPSQEEFIQTITKELL